MLINPNNIYLFIPFIKKKTQGKQTFFVSLGAGQNSSAIANLPPIFPHSAEIIAGLHFWESHYPPIPVGGGAIDTND